MAKLLKHQLKENIRDIIPWMVIPLILSLVLNYINLYFDSAFLDFITVISMVVMYSSFAISMIIVILNDYKKFYGEEAAFYDVLPVKSKDITTSRILNIMILAILAGLIFLIEFFGFLVISTGQDGIGIKELFDQIKSFFDQFPSKKNINNGDNNTDIFLACNFYKNFGINQHWFKQNFQRYGKIWTCFSFYYNNNNSFSFRANLWS